MNEGSKEGNNERGKGMRKQRKEARKQRKEGRKGKKEGRKEGRGVERKIGVTKEER